MFYRDSSRPALHVIFIDLAEDRIITDCAVCAARTVLSPSNPNIQCTDWAVVFV